MRGTGVNILYACLNHPTEVTMAAFHIAPCKTIIIDHLLTTHVRSGFRFVGRRVSVSRSHKNDVILLTKRGARHMCHSTHIRVLILQLTLVPM